MGARPPRRIRWLAWMGSKSIVSATNRQLSSEGFVNIRANWHLIRSAEGLPGAIDDPGGWESSRHHDSRSTDYRSTDYKSHTARRAPHDSTGAAGAIRLATEYDHGGSHDHTDIQGIRPQRHPWGCADYGRLRRHLVRGPVRLGPLLGITTPTRHRTPEGQ